jgi:hypothetical protein
MAFRAHVLPSVSYSPLQTSIKCVGTILSISNYNLSLDNSGFGLSALVASNS